MKNYAIILASGTGSRFGDSVPKQFVKIASKTILELAIEPFEQSNCIDKIIVVITPEYFDFAKSIIEKRDFKKIAKIVRGGAIRKESSYIGISAVEDLEANVLIHDCARALVSQKIISDCAVALEKYEAVNVAIPAVDTVLKVKDNFIVEVPKRDELMLCQTPQCFRLSLIKKAHELSKDDNNFSDDCGLILKHNLAPVYIVQGSSENFKITYKSDIYRAEGMLKAIRSKEVKR